MTIHAQNRAQSLKVDRSACAGHGLCYGAEPEIVDSDDQASPSSWPNLFPRNYEINWVPSSRCAPNAR